MVGIDVGGTTVSAGAVDECGRVLRAARAPTDRTGTLLSSLVTLARSFADLDPQAVGVGVPGAVDARTGRVLGPVYNLPSLTDRPLGAQLRRALKLPVIVDNDVNALALAELRWGAAAGARDFVMIAMGTGVGGAIVLDGQLRRGAHGHAGELGHATVNFDGRECFCGSTGCLKAYLAGPDLAQQDDLAIDAREVVARALRGEPRARSILDEAARALGAACANVIHTIDPERIILGGGVIRAGAALLRPTRAWARRYTLPAVRGKTPILLSKLNKHNAFLGAAALAWTQLRKQG